MNHAWRRRPRWKLLAIVVMGLVSSSFAEARQELLKQAPPPMAQGEVGKLKLADKPISVLRGRLEVRMPEDHKVRARLLDLMNAPEPEERETLVACDVGKERLVLIATELFAFAGDDFEGNAKRYVAKWPGKYQVEPRILLGTGLKAVAILPRNPPDHTRSNDATFVEGLFIRSSDGTVQELSVYVNADAENDPQGCKSIASKILSSVVSGKKRLDLSGGERKLFANSDASEISIRVPKDTVATTQVGPDFLVYLIIPLQRLGDDPVNMLLYLGYHPDYHSGATRGKALIFAKEVEWHALAEGEGLETLCKPPLPRQEDIEIELVSHIILRFSNDSQRDALKKMAESMKIIKRERPASNKP